MENGSRLQLSLFTLPDVSIGRAPLTPQNSQVDPRRLQYLDGMLAYLKGLSGSLREQYPLPEASARLERILQQIPYRELVRVDLTGNPAVTETPGVRDQIGFNPSRLRINFLDGRRRNAESASIPAGCDSPCLSRIVSMLSGGITEQELSRLLQSCDLHPAPLIESVRNLEIIEEVPESLEIVPAVLRRGTKDRLTWLGHAGVLFQTGRSSICVDPFLRPHIRWTKEDLQSSFSETFGERFFFDPYGPQLTQLSPAQLPKLDAVFVTHQDIDHCNPGVLMMLPEDVPIIVPECDPRHSWEVDLAVLIRNVLGDRRKVICLRHGESICIGDVRATAFPFVAEMPSSLKTLWNCYLFETERSAVACTADSAITDESVNFLIDRLSGTQIPWTLCSRSIHSGTKTPGYRDELEVPFNFSRLWAWYVPVWDLFQPVEQAGISYDRLRKLCGNTNLRFYLPYAMGTAPWYRIANASDPLYVPMANLSFRELEAMSARLEEISEKPSLFPGKYGKPLSLED
jgi:L-ascorbate metabolism protein UlaG (beta-lactamase superfamily)